ncbi:hypothetical protein QE417_000279 [Mucilaginibacter terrae]|uniref:Uncharacterized protein n=1 Tax=Mucilaginibacter terrae TaxID=1955052 RepID=A0ABU3GN52_9SPHI|nr:hypothetical protein [Mucilaginibacter terrae]
MSATTQSVLQVPCSISLNSQKSMIPQMIYLFLLHLKYKYYWGPIISELISK